MKHTQKNDDTAGEKCTTMCATGADTTFTDRPHLILTSVVEATYTTTGASLPRLARRVRRRSAMAFVRRKGNAFYLVHNVRRGGKVQQLHLARLGERARITDDIVREVSKKHPFVELNWRSLRQQLNNQ